ERDLTKALIDRRVDGLIIMPAANDHRYVLSEQQAGTSFVFVDRLPMPLLADAIVSENRSGARRAVEHLLRTRRDTIAYFGDDLGIPTARDRYDGFTDALSSAGLTPDPKLARHGLRTAEHARQAASELFAEQRPLAAFTSQNLVTIGVVEALHAMGMQQQVAIVGFDDIPLAGALQPGITVMAQDPAGVGGLAAERLFARLAGDRSPAVVHTVPTRLITRGSGELPLG
ncbi:MAG TPA: substrate-binding domain-containing protein, partial [Jatrophihabitantaceae bacterium]|nr:substrate-binding domain-containing protein [Jatrophihabitantaceae bacterium]